MPTTRSGYVSVARNEDGRLELFWLYKNVDQGPDHYDTLHHSYQTVRNNGWSPLVPFYGGVDHENSKGCLIATNGDGRLEVFIGWGTVKTGDPPKRGGLLHSWQQTADDSESWSGVKYLENLEFGIGRLAATNKDGRIELFRPPTWGLPDGIDRVRHLWQLAPGGGAGRDGWSTDAELAGAGVRGGTGVGQNGDGRLEVFAARGQFSNPVWDTWQKEANAGWTNWNNLGGALDGVPEVAENPDGTLEVFCRARFSGEMHHTWQLPEGGWHTWAGLGGTWPQYIAPAVGHTKSGTLTVVMLGTDSQHYFIQRPAGGGNWIPPWKSLGGQWADNVVLAQNDDNHLEAFCTGLDNRLYHNWETGPAQWSGWARF